MRSWRKRWGLWRNPEPNPKIQIPNPNKIPNLKSQTSGRGLETWSLGVFLGFGFWDLGFLWGLGICGLRFPPNRHYLFPGAIKQRSVANRRRGHARFRQIVG